MGQVGLDGADDDGQTATEHVGVAGEDPHEPMFEPAAAQIVLEFGEYEP